MSPRSDSEDSRSPSPLPKSNGDDNARNSRSPTNKDSEGKKRSESPTTRKSRSKTRSKTRSKSRSRSASPLAKVDRKSRSRSRSRRRTKSRSRSRNRSRSRDRRRSRTRSRSRDRRSRAYTPEEEDDGYRLHVADLDSSAAKRDLERIFGKYGPLKEIWMARSNPCFAFVVYRHKDDAEEACRMTDGTDVLSRRIKVTFARPRTRGRGRRGFDPSMRCYQCGDRGHFSRDCPDGMYGYKRPPSPSRDRYRSRRSSGDRYDRDRRSRY